MSAAPPLEEMFPRFGILEEYDPGYVKEVRRSWKDAREFAEKVAKKKALEIDEKAGKDHNYFDWDVVKEGLKYKLLSITIPKEFGGRGRLAVDCGIVMEEICSACAGIANIFGAHALGTLPLLVSGSIAHCEQQLREVAEAEARGEPVLFALAITEPGAGSDVEEPEFIDKAMINTEAKKVDGGYVLNGRKCFISNGSVAKYVTVEMPLDRGRLRESMTWFLVSANSKGFSVGRVEEKMGQRACPAAELVFDDVFVPEEDVIGFEGEGVEGTMLGLAASRGPVGAIGTGIARGAYEWFVDYAENTRVNGRALIEERMIQTAISEMAVKIHLARQAYMDAAMQLDFLALGRLLNHRSLKLMGLLPKNLRTSGSWIKMMNSVRFKNYIRNLVNQTIPPENNTRAMGYASMAKAVGSDVAMEVTTKALELVGPGDSVHRRWIEKFFRDAKLTQIYEGTNQINRMMYYKTVCSREFKIEQFKTQPANRK